MPLEETGKTRDRTDCLKFDVFLCIPIKKQISIRGRKHWGIYFLWDFASRWNSRWYKISWFNNRCISTIIIFYVNFGDGNWRQAEAQLVAFLQLVRDIINGVCYQRCEKTS